jgi:hypothetical protein
MLEMYMEIQQLIKLGFSQTKVAEKLGVSKKHFCYATWKSSCKKTVFQNCIF